MQKIFLSFLLTLFCHNFHGQGQSRVIKLLLKKAVRNEVVEGARFSVQASKKILKNIYFNNKIVAQSDDILIDIIENGIVRPNIPFQQALEEGVLKNSRVFSNLNDPFFKDERAWNKFFNFKLNQTNEIGLTLSKGIKIRISVKKYGSSLLGSDVVFSNLSNREYFEFYFESVKDVIRLKNFQLLNLYKGKTDLIKYDYDLVNNIFRKFQKKYNIKIDKTKNPESFYKDINDLLEKKIKEYKTNLSKMGLEGDINEVLKDYQNYKSLNPTGIIGHETEKALNSDIKKGFFFDSKGKIYIKKKVEIDSKIFNCVELNKNLYFKLDSENKSYLHKISEDLKRRKFQKDEFEIISLIRDSRTTDYLKSNFPNNHLSFDFSSMNNFIKELKKHNKKTIFVIGHIEGDIFVTHLRNGLKFEISIDELQKLSRELDINVFPLGCKSAKSGSGIVNDFNSIEALKRLRKALDNNSTTMSILENLAGTDFKIMIDKAVLKDKGYLEAKILRKNKVKGAIVVSSIGVGSIIIIYNSSK